ncbi:hypothetical protein [Nocardia sp. IFM 10818]
MERAPHRTTVPRLIDLLCGPHQHSAQFRWPTTGQGLSSIFEQCRDCERTSQGRHVEFGENILDRVLPDLDAATYARALASHEAGHATVAALTGHPVLEVSVRARHDTSRDGLAGETTLGEFSVAGEDHLAMLWAGNQAMLRWLATTDHNTAANRVDINYGAKHDLAAIERITQPHRVAIVTGRRLADEYLDKHWGAVQAITNEVSENYRISGASVHELVTHPTRASSRVESPPATVVPLERGRTHTRKAAPSHQSTQRQRRHRR